MYVARNEFCVRDVDTLTKALEGRLEVDQKTKGRALIVVPLQDH